MFKSFILTGLVFTGLVGWFFGVLLVGGFPQKSEWRKRILATIISLSFGFAISGMLHLEIRENQKAWNNGVCPNCETEWRFASADRHGISGTTYYYACDNCGKIIEQNH